MTFAFQKLTVWQKAVHLIDDIMYLADNLNSDKPHYKLIEQLESCSTSIALNIAEGKGKHTNKNFIRHLYIARGSLYESLTLLVLFRKREWISEEQLEDIESQALDLTKMMMGLIKSLSPQEK